MNINENSSNIKKFDTIIIEGAKENNLKNVSLEIPKHKFNVISGVSGSGKSSLAFDCIYSSAQASFYETLSTYVVKNLPKINKPNVDNIINLSPCVLVEQRKLGSSPRSTVGTYTEIYTHLRLLYSRIGYPIYDSNMFSFNSVKGACPNCQGLGLELCVDINKLIDFNLSLNEGAIKHRTWKVGSRYFNIQKSTGYFDMDKKLSDYSKEELDLLLYKESTNFMNKEQGFVQNWSYEGIISRLLKRQGDSRGLKINDYDKMFFTEGVCSLCEGSRLNQEAIAVKVNNKSLKDILNIEIVDLYDFINNINDEIVTELLNKIKKDLKCMIDLGIGYLSLNRNIGSLSGGEAQKIKMFKSIDNNLNELVYVMDEPSIGFHDRDVCKIVKAIKNIVGANNTAIVVEHNRRMIKNADNIIDIGPLAGTNGGKIIYNGNYFGLLNNSDSLTGFYLKNRLKLNSNKKTINDYYTVNNISINNVHNLNINIPYNLLTCITGVSGSGKSSIIRYMLKNDDKLIKIGKDNIGVNSRSNIATYTKIFDTIRNLFSKENNISAGEFSFNSTGACSKCSGNGVIKMDMHFLGDVKQVCDVCNGKRYKEEIQKYLYKNKSISDVLEMTIKEALDFFENSDILEKLNIMKDVGLEYLKLGQTLDTLSGGEVQRINMSNYLVKKGNIYIFDEPTQGLHFKDIELLKDVMRKIIKNGNTIIVIEHNLDFILDCDYIIDIGPDSGKFGGKIVYEGYPIDIIDKNTYTAQAIKEYLL